MDNKVKRIYAKLFLVHSKSPKQLPKVKVVTPPPLPYNVERISIVKIIRYRLNTLYMRVSSSLGQLWIHEGGR